MPCKTVTVPGPEETNGGDNGNGGDDGTNGGDGGTSPEDLISRVTKFVKDRPLETAGVVGAGIFLATTSMDDDERQSYVPYQPRPADKDRTSDKRDGGIDKL